MAASGGEELNGGDVQAVNSPDLRWHGSTRIEQMRRFGVG